MRTRTRLEIGHLAVFVGVAVVLNAQFTWWVFNSLRDNRERLDLQRAVVLARAERANAELGKRLLEAVSVLPVKPSGVIPVASPPFSQMRVIETQSPTANSSWVVVDSTVTFVRPFGQARRLEAVLEPQTLFRWMSEVDGELQLVNSPTDPSNRPHLQLSAPLAHLWLTPDFHRWRDTMEAYRHRIIVVLAGSAFFLAAMVASIVLLWRVLRREDALERQHQNFISAVTHELKTPIAGIRVALDTVLSGRVDEIGAKKFLSNAVADAERLANLVEKILEVTRYTGGAHRLRIEVGDLSLFIEEEVDVARRRADPLGVRLVADILPGVQAPMDPEALAIVLSNLIENAFKYAKGSPPCVWVRVKVERGEAVIEVKDNGLGLKGADLEAVFRPFFRVVDEVTRRTPGTGIGLFIAREIVTAHGGRLTAVSDGPGKGATFKLVLPGADVLPEEAFSG